MENQKLNINYYNKIDHQNKDSQNTNSKANYDISIVIVNYNVKDYLNQCLRSIENSKVKQQNSTLKIQTIVVDNNSTDNSITYLHKLFPNVLFIALNQNLGFSKANNIGFSHCDSKYTLILNPDTIISEDTLEVMFQYLENNKDIGLAGCKVLNPDGTFQLPCRRGFPTPWVAFTKLFGLQKLFPKVKLFAGYNLTYLNENETNEIDALIGAFMFVRTDILKQIKGFDEDFFMYGEDLDLCYRIHKLGHKIVYYPKTTIVHFKGESTKRSNIDELYHFFEAMKIYASKHYSKSKVFLQFLKFGINLRYLLANITKYKNDVKYIFSDLIITNFSLLAATKLAKGEFFWFPDYAYPKVFFIVPLIVILSKFSIGEYFEGNKSSLRIIYSQLISFFVLSSLTYFFKDYAFSRGVILLLIAFSTILMLNQLLLENHAKSNKSSKNKRILIVGNITEYFNFAKNIEQSDKNSKVIGFVYDSNTQISESQKNTNVITGIFDYLGHIDYLPKLIQDYFINEVIISNPNFDKKIYTSLKYKNLDFKDKFHFVTNYTELQLSRVQNALKLNINLVDNDIIPLRYKFFKRIIDITFSMFLLTIGIPLLYLFFKFDKNTIISLLRVFIGKYSLIGVELHNNIYRSSIDNNFKKGIITLNNVFLNSNNTDVLEKLDKLYIEHYNLSLDFELLIKFLVGKNGK